MYPEGEILADASFNVQEQNNINISNPLLNNVQKEKTLKTRWSGCLLCTLFLFGCFYDILGLYLTQQMVGKLFEWSIFTTSIQQYWLNMFSLVMPFIAGIVVTKWGLRATLIMFSGLSLFSQVLFWVSCFAANGTIFIISRGIFFFATAPAIILYVLMTIKWSNKKDLGVALGIPLIGEFFGTHFSKQISYNLFINDSTLTTAALIQAFMMGISLVAVIIWAKLDKKMDEENQSQAILPELQQTRVQFYYNQGILKTIEGFISLVWVGIPIIFIIQFIYQSIFTSLSQFLTNSNSPDGVFMKEKNYPYKYLFLVIGLTGALVGKIIDNQGKRIANMIIAGFLSVLGTIWFLNLGECDQCLSGYLLYFIIGISYTLYFVSFWSSVVYFEKAKNLALAIGLMFTGSEIIGQLIQFLFNVVIARKDFDIDSLIKDNARLFLFISCLGLICTFLVASINKQRKLGLNQAIKRQ